MPTAAVFCRRPEIDILNRIGAGQNPSSIARWNNGAERKPGAERKREPCAQSDKAAIAVDRKLVFGKRTAALCRREKLFAARGAPFHRLSQTQGSECHHDVFRIKRSLAAKGAANIRRYDPHFIFRDADDAGEINARTVRCLGSYPRRNHSVWVGKDQRTPRFQRCRRQARMRKMDVNYVRGT